MEAFSPVARTARPALLRDYREYLRARDGIVDVTNRTLSKREDGMRRFLVTGDRWMDREVFQLQYERFDPRALLPIVALGLSSAIPEVRALGAIPQAPVEAITALARRGLPETVRRHAFFT